ncbi:MAG: hypothetical protein QXJ68_07620 [Methanocellales archaeon]
MQEIDPTYPYLVKNLRGVIYYSKQVNPESELKWLKKKFRYRELGISENLKLKKQWKKLITLPKIEATPELDSLIQASKYICPLLILKEESLRDFKDLIIAELKTNEIEEKALKFNLRLVNYSITDFYLKSIEFARQDNLSARRKLAEEDLKRFWRIKTSEKGKTLIAYIDPLLDKEIKLKIKNLSIIPSLILDFG